MISPLWSSLYECLVTLAVVSARITPMFFLLPFFSGSIVSITVRTPVIFFVGAALWPYSFDAMASLEGAHMLEIVLREAAIGLLLAILLALPFWVMHGLGALIDYQRGALLSSAYDPISGVDTSELANLFNLFFAAVFLQGGGLTLLLEVFVGSYQLCDPLQPCLPSLGKMTTLLETMTTRILVLSSPVLAALLLIEILLGMLSRFAPQMNAFAIALTLKSGVTFLIMLIYFAPLLPDMFRQYWLTPPQLEAWLSDDPSKERGNEQ
ncbi:type III secretion system export apparatus subunit SctT [Sodalis endosymbiont of Spalangia cameroni]|uniref:type III secretion system export apparatus subunit SctT n=1 Tax=Sodalis praecaptivus TaxID=1239307 RepID=UPI0031F7525A